MIYPRAEAAAAVWNGKIIICGGMTIEHELLNSAECYDPESGLWTELVEMPHPFYKHSLLPYGDNLVLAGGCMEDEALWSGHMELDPLKGRNGTWTKLPGLKHDWDAYGLATLDNNIYAVGTNYVHSQSLPLYRHSQYLQIFDGKRLARWTPTSV